MLEQERSDEAKELLDKLDTDRFYISDFTLRSIGVILCRLKKYDNFIGFIDDLFIHGDVKQLTLEPIELKDIAENIQKYYLDFDDSYQYAVSLKYDLRIVTFDKDFSKNGIETIEPIDILKMIDN